MKESHSTQVEECALCAFNIVEVPGALDKHIETLLTTNTSPESADLPTLASQLESAQALSAKFDEWIVGMESALKRMRDTKAALEPSILQYQGALHPIRSVPDDILFTIFDWCTFSATQRKDAMSMCKDRAPWVLSHVSRRWRTLTLASPSLWSTICICPLRYPVKPKIRARLTSWLAEHIRRSSQCDLFIRILGARDDDSPLDDKLVGECILLLLSTPNRWRKVELLDVSYTMLNQLSVCSFERLKEMRVLLRLYRVTSIRKTITLSMPNLTRLTLEGDVAGAIELKWERLQSYFCDATGLKHLPRCATLEKLSLPEIYPESIRWAIDTLGPSHISTPITLPTVRAMDMWHEEMCHSIPQISDLLALPSLITLRLCLDKFRSVFPSFRGAIAHLQHLSISVHKLCSDSPEPFLTFLAECISLTTLYIDVGITDDRVLTSLRVSEDHDNAVLLPKLTAFGVDEKLLERFPGGVMDVVLSRSGGNKSVCTLTQLKVLPYLGNEGVWEEGWKKATKLTPELMEKWLLVKQTVRVGQISAHIFPFQ